MTVISYTRRAKCKDCDFLKYYYKGKQKIHHCSLKNECRILNDYVCDEWKLSTTGLPQPLKNVKS